MLALAALVAAILPAGAAAATYALSEVDEKPELKSGGASDYPKRWMREGVSGQVVASFVITAKGRVENVVIKSATQPEFAEAAKKYLPSREYSPGKKAGQPVDIQTEQLLNFVITYTVAKNKTIVLAGTDAPDPGPNQLQSFQLCYARTFFDGMLPSDVAPEPIQVVKAVYPYELFGEAITGSVDVRYVLGKEGQILFSEVTRASKPAFGAAALAAIRATKFKPGQLRTDAGNVPCFSERIVTLSFKKGSRDVAVDEVTATLAGAIKQGTPGAFVSAKQLDKPLNLVRKVDPTPPAGTGKGKLLVDIIIDRTGAIQLPRVQDRAGYDDDVIYSTLTALSQWRFDPPMREGKPVDVQVKIPVSF